MLAEKALQMSSFATLSNRLLQAQQSSGHVEGRGARCGTRKHQDIQHCGRDSNFSEGARIRVALHRVKVRRDLEIARDETCEMAHWVPSRTDKLPPVCHSWAVTHMDIHSPLHNHNHNQLHF